MPMFLLRVRASTLLYSIHVGKWRASGFLHVEQECLTKQVPEQGLGLVLQRERALQLQ